MSRWAGKIVQVAWVLIGLSVVGNVAAIAAVGETAILLHPPLPLVGVSIAMERERPQNDSLADGQAIVFTAATGGLAWQS